MSGRVRAFSGPCGAFATTPPLRACPAAFFLLARAMMILVDCFLSLVFSEGVVREYHPL